MILVTKLIKKIGKYDPKSKQLLKNITLSLFIKGAALVVSLFNLPAYMNYFSDQTILGMWFTAISMLSWILTFDLGVGNGLRNHLVEPLVKNDVIEVKKFLSSAYFTVGIIVACLSAISVVILPQLDWNTILNISCEVVRADTLLFMIIMLTLGILLQFWLKLITSVLYALQNSGLIGLLTLASSTFLLIYTVIAKTNNPEFNIRSISIAFVFTANIPYLLISLVLFSRRLKDSRPSMKFYVASYAKKIITLGGVFFYLQILTMIIFGTNEFLISYLIDPQQVVAFQIYNKLFSLVSTIFNLAITPVWSAVREACVKKDIIWIKQLNIKLNKLLLILVPCEAILILLMPYIMKIWLGENATETNYVYCAIFAIYNIMFMKVSVDTSIIAGIGDLKIQSISLSLTTVLKIFLSVVLIQLYKDWISIIAANIFSLLPYIFIEYFDIKNKYKLINDGGNNEKSIQHLD